MESPERRHPLYLASLLVILLISACGDSTTQPPPGELSVALTAQALTDATDNISRQNEIADALADLSNEIAFVMASGGLPLVDGGVRPTLDLAELAPALKVIADRRSSDWIPTAQLAIGPRPPLGVTCVWNPEISFWAGGEDIYGPVPSTAIRFELYRTDGDVPVLPLESFNTFSDVRAGPQGTQQTGIIDFHLTTDANQGSRLVDFPLVGTFGGPGLFDMEVPDGFLAGGGDILSFDADFEPDVVRVGSSVRDINLDESISVNVSGIATVALTVQNTASPAQTIVYSFSFDLFDSSEAILPGGLARVDGSTVATISGTANNPIFTLTDDSRLPSSQRTSLVSIFRDADELAGSVLDLFFLGGCIGSDDPGFCESFGISR